MNTHTRRKNGKDVSNLLVKDVILLFIHKKCPSAHPGIPKGKYPLRRKIILVPHVSSAAPKETQVVLLFFLWQEMSGVCSLQQFSPGECGKHECHSASYSKRDNGSCKLDITVSSPEIQFTR